MATTTICDLCARPIVGDVVRVRFRDGEYPSNRNTMHRTVDVCGACLSQIPDLHSEQDLADVTRHQVPPVRVFGAVENEGRLTAGRGEGA